MIQLFCRVLVVSYASLFISPACYSICQSSSSVEINSDAIIESASKLAKEIEVDFRGLTIQQAVDQLAEKHALTFISPNVSKLTAKPTDIVARNRLGEILLQLLKPIGCEFAIRPNGEIILSETPKLDNAEDDAEPKYPTFAELKQFAGTKFETAEFQAFIDKYDFSKNHKRDRSWGSGIGVFIELSREDTAIMGVRPIGAGFGQKYRGELPSDVKQGDSLKTVLKKLGKPLKTTGKKNGYHTLYYDGFHVISTHGSLFELWISPDVKGDPPRLPKRQRKAKNAG